MAKISNIQILEGGTYYTFAPRIVIDPPDYDSDRFGGSIDSSRTKFGCGSLLHDSNDVTTLDPLTDSGVGIFKFVSQSFWLYLDSLQPCTLAWSEDFRIFVNNNNNLAISLAVDSSDRQAGQTENVQVLTTQSLFLQANKWHFIKVETNQNYANQQGNLRIGIDSNYTGTYVMNAISLYDSGSVIRLGYDSGYTGPEHKENILGQYVTDSDINKSFVGNIDNYQFTIDTNKSTYNNQFSNWRPDSAEETYEGLVPMLWETFDFKRAKGIAVIDSFGAVSAINIVDSGCGYDSSQDIGIEIIGGSVVDSDYAVGDTVTQLLSGGATISGEIQSITLDSAGDSSRCYYLAHVGADDGKYHTFDVNDMIRPFNAANGALINSTKSANTGLTVKSVSEDNKISETEQNETFSDFSDDFLDFSENNPFGDPEDQ